MLPVLYAAGSPAQSPPACQAADPAVTSLTSELFKRRGASDHYVITTTITNVGTETQTPDVMQRIELVREGKVLAPQSFPALGAGVAYKLAFAVDRPAAERSQPLTVTVRYVLSAGDAVRNACNHANDEITKTF